MRKILILLGMMALAFGAWAQGKYTYSFTLTVHCPADYNLLGPNASYFLINTDNQKCYFYFASSEWTIRPQTVDPTTHYLRDDVIRDGSTSVTWHDTTYSIIASHTKGSPTGPLNQANSMQMEPEGSGAKVLFRHQFATDNLITLKEITGIENPSSYGGEASNLKLVMVDPDMGRDVALDVGYTAVGGPIFFTMEANFGPVPEPTSGMMLLVGLAGLALRRRRMA